MKFILPINKHELVKTHSRIGKRIQTILDEEDVSDAEINMINVWDMNFYKECERVYEEQVLPLWDMLNQTSLVVDYYQVQVQALNTDVYMPKFEQISRDPENNFIDDFENYDGIVDINNDKLALMMILHGFTQYKG